MKPYDASEDVSVAEVRLLAEETVRPIPVIVPLVLWVVAVVVITSVVSSFWEPAPDFLPGWFQAISKGFDTIGVILAPFITLTLATIFTVIYILFTGIRYRIYTDRMEYQRGKHHWLWPLTRLDFGAWQTLDFSELDAIHWKVQGIGDESPSGMTFLEFDFASRTMQLHKSFKLSGKVAEACRLIERETIVPKILRSLEDGKTVAFLRPDQFPAYEIEIDDKTIRDWDQHRFSWNEICKIGFSKGRETRYGDYLTQSRIRIESTSKEAMEFDMPRRNPHALWAVLMDRCKLPTLQVLNFPKNEPPLSR